MTHRGLEHRHELGVDRIMWSTDFPHPATSWPNSQGVVERNFEGIPNHERDLIVAGNAFASTGYSCFFIQEGSAPPG